ncbi:hypothetical protein [Vitiosangium sp. GDMCC 1.1324]|uniref:hypothetical protein n=1 Tax=Vitiosangium sp. (strain GDMCC 1.1324) TaxID=2138576 RepID=UPI000D337EA3|nr:hypothetical protein [Vitiosangium sp. GDMCC 1.1324]PTL83266.1 hypothetical protein DAT35_14850 [Vitiosangium sp. GDMCC 1.1324]
MSHEATLTLRQARERYFEENGFGQGGNYDKRWVRVDVGPVPFWFPNSKERVRALRFHDLHHVLTGYRTDFPGECEISAWEVAGGCTDHAAAWVLNLMGMGAGLFFMPRRLARAFQRGLHTRNLYRSEYGETLLGRTVEDMRRELGMETPVPAPTWKDRCSFASWSVAALLMSALAMAVFLTPLALAAWVLASLLH